MDETLNLLAVVTDFGVARANGGLFVGDNSKGMQPGLSTSATGQFSISAGENGVALSGTAEDVKVNEEQQLPRKLPVIASLPDLLVTSIAATLVTVPINALLAFLLTGRGARRDERG